jgi:hypothetical protein
MAFVKNDRTLSRHTASCRSLPEVPPEGTIMKTIIHTMT